MSDQTVIKAQKQPPASLWTIFLWHYSFGRLSEAKLAALAEQARETPEESAKRATRLYVLFALPTIVAGVAIAMAPVALAIYLLPASSNSQWVKVLVLGLVAAGSFVFLVPGTSAISCYIWARLMLRRRWLNLANIEAVIRTGQPYLE